jgi:hypothetical protein
VIGFKCSNGQSIVNYCLLVQVLINFDKCRINFKLNLKLYRCETNIEEFG